MGLFENSHFPYTNFHELNLDKIMDVTKDAKETADRAETKADQAAATVGTFDQRITENTENIDNAQERITAVNAVVVHHSNQIVDLIQEDSNLGSRITTLNGEVSGVTRRVTDAERDIERLDNTDTQLQTNIDSKSTVTVEQGTLDGGVLTGTIYVNGTPTRLYAPTAGSTVVRAVDVPYTADPTSWIDSDGNQLNPIEVQQAIDFITGNLVGATAMYFNKLFYKWSNLIVTENVDSLIASGFVTTGGSEVWFMVPYSKHWDRNSINPIDSPTAVQFSISGHITIRGVSGYVLNNIDFNDTSISRITISAREAGYQVVLKLTNAISSLNNTAATIRLTNRPTIQIRQV